MKKFRPGVSFGDFVIWGMARAKSRVQEEKVRDFRRGWLAWLSVVVGFGLVAVRLADLQILNGGKYRILADENRIKTVRLPAPRGRLLDRNGVELPKDEATGHVTGYLGEVSEEEVGLLKEKGQKYGLGNMIGRTGLEAEYEKELRGVDGGKLVEVDNVGEIVRELGQKNPEPGKDLALTVDGQLQEAAYEAVKGKKAGVVVSDPRTGEVLALVSSPGFDPDEVSAKYEVLSTKEDLPFFNRAIGGVYPPGSTFKMVTTLAALESGRVARDYTYEDRGVVTVGSYSYTNWYFTKRGGVEGIIGFSRALARSTDTFFYKVGELTGPLQIVDWAKKMGFGQKTGIDLPGEMAGWVPDPAKGEWYLGNTYHLAIGQEDLLVTPLQINLMTNVLASGGKKCKPHFVNFQFSITNFPFGFAQGEQFSNSLQCPNVQISNETLEVIKKGMVGACSQGGTSFVMFDWNGDLELPTIACKTGTAEYYDSKLKKVKTHAWFTAFAPADDPVVSATVVVEGGGEGSNVAAPVVRKIFARYFGIEDTYPYGAIRGVGE